MENKRKHKVHRGRRKPNRIVTWFKGLSKKKKIALGVGAAVVALILLLVFFVLAKFGKLQTADISGEDILVNEELSEEVRKGYTNFVLFAGDSRTGKLDKGVRSDGIIVVSLNNETKEVKMVSVYRDTLLDLTTGRLAKCNAAYSYGGAKQAISMLNMNLDLNIEKFVTVDFTAVSDVVDMLGGIEVEVSDAEARAVNKYINETARVAKKEAHHLSGGGLLTLDGVQATTYGRIRKGVGDDYARTERQRLIIQKAMEKALKSDIGTLNKIVDAVLPKVYTNFTKTEILSYGASIAKYKIGETKGFPIDRSGARLSGKGSCIIPVTLESNVVKLHEFLFGTIDYKPSSKVVSISNEIRSLVGERKPTPNKNYSSSQSNKDNKVNKNEDKKDKDTSGKNGNQTSSKPNANKTDEGKDSIKEPNKGTDTQVDNKPTKPETSTPATKPETSTPATKPETSTPATKPETSTPATKPETSTPATKPETSTPDDNKAPSVPQSNKNTEANSNVGDSTGKNNQGVDNKTE